MTTSRDTSAPPPPPEEARRIAAEAWIYGYALLENYRTMYAQAVDTDDPRSVGGFGRFRHHPDPFAPADTDPLTRPDDTPYSWAWLDLRTEPWVVSVPAVDRYYVLPFHDVDTTYVGFVGARVTGQEAGDHLIAGPGWDGPVPEGIASVLRADTQLVGCLGRTQLTGPADVENVRALQERYVLRPLSAYIGGAAPEPAPEPVWPVWRDGTDAGATEVLETPEFLVLLDFLLGFFPELPQEAALRERLASLGVDGAGRFDPASFSATLRDAVEQGIADGRARLTEAEAHAPDSARWFGTRAQLGDDHLTRAVGVAKGLYGLPREEAWCAYWTLDSEGNRPPDAAARDYLVRFAPGGLPPARFFWTLCAHHVDRPGRPELDRPARSGLPDLPDRPDLSAEGPMGTDLADRRCRAVSDRTPGLVLDADGGLTLSVQHERPDDPREAANWLPAPYGPFTAVLRLYGPGPTALDGTWTLPELRVRRSARTASGGS